MANRHAKPDPDQLRLDFTGPFKERCGVFRAGINAWEPEDLECSSHVLGIYREILKAVFVYSGGEWGEWCRAGVVELCEHAEKEHCEIEPGTFKNRRTQLIKRGLIEKELYHQSGNKKYFQYRVCRRLWAEITSQARERLARQRKEDQRKEQKRKAPSPASSQHPSQSDALLPTVIDCDRVFSTVIDCDALRNPQSPIPNPQSSTPPTSKSNAAKTNRPSPCSDRPPVPDTQHTPRCHESKHPTTITGWVGWFVEELKVDPRNVRNTLRAFREVKGTSDVLAEIVQVYRERPGAWGPGALLTRIQRWRPGDKPAASWPPPDLEAEKSESMKAAAARRPQELAQQARRRRESQRERAANQAERDELAAAWGSLSEAEREELLDQHRPDWRAMSFDDTSSTLMATMVPREAIERLASAVTASGGT